MAKRAAGDPATPEQGRDDRLPAAPRVVAFALIATAKVFRRTWKAPRRLLGVRAFAAVHALGDGASGIWKSVNRVLTGCTQTLDIDHASQRVRRCAQAIFGEGTAATAACERGRGLLVRDGGSGICAWVAELLGVDDPGERERRRPATEALVGYFAAHVGRLN